MINDTSVLIEQIEDENMIEEMIVTMEDMHAIYLEGISENGMEVEVKAVIEEGSHQYGAIYGRPLLSEDWEYIGEVEED